MLGQATQLYIWARASFIFQAQHGQDSIKNVNEEGFFNSAQHCLANIGHGTLSHHGFGFVKHMYSSLANGLGPLTPSKPTHQSSQILAKAIQKQKAPHCIGGYGLCHNYDQNFLTSLREIFHFSPCFSQSWMANVILATFHTPYPPLPKCS